MTFCPILNMLCPRAEGCLGCYHAQCLWIELEGEVVENMKGGA